MRANREKALMALIFTIFVLFGCCVIAIIALATDAEEIAGLKARVDALQALNCELADQVEAAQKRVIAAETGETMTTPQSAAPTAPLTRGAEDGNARTKGEDFMPPSAADGGSSPEGGAIGQGAELTGVKLIGAFDVTHYCVCAQCCGTETGITASGRAAVPDYSIAVDPSVIPLGASVLADYGDGILHEYRADDTGGAVKGNVIDLCVADHATALFLGRRSATVYLKEELK